MKRHPLTALLLAATLFLATRTAAQDTSSSSKPSIQLGESQWKAVVGVFQSPQNADMKVRFSFRENKLLAELLWNGGALHLQPESATAFTSIEKDDGEAIHITFRNDSAGRYTTVDVAKNGTWTRVNDYKPAPAKQAMTHTPDQLKRFEGVYHMPDREYMFISLLIKDNNLVLKQHWDNSELSFQPDTDSTFFMVDRPVFTLDFKKDAGGNITGFTAFKRDNWKRTTKPTLTTAQLAALAGKYQSNDDPDNLIELSARDNHLIVKQLWDKKQITLDALAEGYFYNGTESYSLQQTKDRDGKPAILLLGMDFFERVK
ncbi:MAG TPA: hypothetical protein VKQ52_19560 [Puia sp.]|nr:hypothetical protein [Puia sp.]